MKFKKLVKSFDKTLQYSVLVGDIQHSIEEALEKYSYRDMFSPEEIGNAIKEAVSKIK